MCWKRKDGVVFLPDQGVPDAERPLPPGTTEDATPRVDGGAGTWGGALASVLLGESAAIRQVARRIA